MKKTDFVIITALEEEREAVLNKLPGYQQLNPIDDDIRIYYQADLPITFPDGSMGSYRIVVLSLLGMGRVQATISTADAIRQWQPRYVILVGIAGGIAAREVKLGDILVSDQVVDYELQKLAPEGPQIRWDVHRADPRLVNVARNFKNNSYQALITTRRPDKSAPVRHIGPIASGDKVIAFGVILERYRDKWPALIGVEMEAAGVATASFQAAQQPGFFMVRGVSDLADEKKGSAYVKRWRSYACEVAAAYVIAFLKSGPVKALFNEETSLPANSGSIKPVEEIEKLRPVLRFYEDEKLVQQIELEDFNWAKPVYLGTARDCQIQIKRKYQQVSRHHAQLIRVGNSYRLKDQSQFGTYINGVKVNSQIEKTLVNGDRIVLGSLSSHDEYTPIQSACFFIFQTGSEQKASN